MDSPSTYFYPSQRDWIRDESPLKLAVKSRQIGFSYCNDYPRPKGEGTAMVDSTKWE